MSGTLPAVRPHDIADRPPSSLAFADSSDVREYLVEALKLDHVGPGAGHDLADELLPRDSNPSTAAYVFRL